MILHAIVFPRISEKMIILILVMHYSFINAPSLVRGRPEFSRVHSTLGKGGVNGGCMLFKNVDYEGNSVVKNHHFQSTLSGGREGEWSHNRVQ